MLITDQFVFIHLPKTGGTFVTQMLKSLLTPSKFNRKVHSARRDWGLKLPGYAYRYSELSKHGMRKHIPPEHQHKPVLTCVRNPLDLYVSQFRFEWWRKNAERWFADTAEAEAEFGSVDNMDFEAFLRATQRYSRWRVEKLGTRPAESLPGRLTLEWVYYFCRDPEVVLEPYPDAGLVAERIREQRDSLRVLRTENLNEDLADFLQEFGFSDDAVQFVRNHEKVFPGRRTRADDDDHRRYYDDELLAEVSRWESVLLDVFYGTPLAEVPS